MIERFFRRKEYCRKREIGILFEKGLNLFFSLPDSDEEYRSGPNSGEIAAKKIKNLPRTDRRFFLEGEESQGSKAKVWAGFGEHCWVGIEVSGLRVRYLGRNPVLQVLHEEKVEDSWRVVFSEEREEWKDFERVIRIGEALLDS